MLSISAVFSSINFTASSLLSSITMIPFSAPTVLIIALRPNTTSSAYAKSTLWSTVRYGSHSQPFKRIVSTGFAGFNFTNVGKPAPPIPTIPASLTISTISSGVRLSRSLFGFTDSCRVSFPSDLITTDRHSPLVACLCTSIAVTVPLTEECTGLLINPPASPIFWPTFTSSPTSTIAFAGAPACIDNGTTTVSGAGNFTKSTCSENSLFSDG